MGTVLLHELMGTHYIIEAFSNRLSNILDDIEKNGDILDLADCKLGTSCRRLIDSKYGKIQMCNSTDAYLNSILQHNTQRAYDNAGAIEKYQDLVISGTKDLSTFEELYQTLEQNGKYFVKTDGLKDMVTLILLIMRRPDIDFDLRECSVPVFNYVREAWLQSPMHHDSYYELIRPDIVKVTINENEKYGNPDQGYYDERSYINYRNVLPYDFGNIDLLAGDENGNISEEWEPVLRKCCEVFPEEESETSEFNKIDLREILPMRGEGYEEEGGYYQ